MRAFKIALSAVATVFISVTSSSAVSLSDNYSNVIIFGDSLSDTGSAAAQAENPVTERFSNGPVWADHFISELEDGGGFGASFAFGGAQTSVTDIVPSMTAQIGLAQGSFGADFSGLTGETLFSLWGGANNIFDALFSNPADPIAAAQAAADDIVAQVSSLLPYGDVLVFNLPDLGQTPLFTGLGLEATGLGVSNAFNAQLAAGLNGLPAGGNDLYRVDIFALFNQMIASPASFGLTNVADQCSAVDNVYCSNTQSYMFYDGVHPTNQVHNQIALEALDVLGVEQSVAFAPAPVPLPAAGWMLVVAISAVGGMRLRRRER